MSAMAEFDHDGQKLVYDPTKIWWPNRLFIKSVFLYIGTTLAEFWGVLECPSVR